MDAMDLEEAPVGMEKGTDEGQKNFFDDPLGSDKYSKPVKVKRSIPYWLANPSVVSIDLKNLDTPVDSIPGLEKMFIKLLKQNNITHFFPVQRQIIPWLMDSISKPDFYWPCDICVSAPTGSGKTLAFVLPILQALHKRIVPEIRAIVVLPVQDLAAQVYKVFKTYSSHTNLNVILLSKKQSFSEEQNHIRLKDDLNRYTTVVDIVVTTPGRLVDHLMNTDGLCLSHIKYIVIDEADKVMDNIQNDWLYHLNKKILSDFSRSYQTPTLTYNNLVQKRRPPQKLLFSATLSQDPEKLQQLGLFQPKLFTSVVTGNENQENASTDRFIGKYTTPAELVEYYTTTTKAEKPLTIHHLISSLSWRGILCFVNTTEVTNRLSFLLKEMNKSLRIKNISAQLSPTNRDKLISDFANGRIDILISTDTLARGIDIPNIKYVISYSLPKYLKTYIHRIGRTGRGGRIGYSLILLTNNEVGTFHRMIEESGKKHLKELELDKNFAEQYTENYVNALRNLECQITKKKKTTLSFVKAVKLKNKIVKRKIK